MKNLVFASTIFLLFAVLFTWPLTPQIGSHGFGVDEDAPYHIWHNWWLKFSLFSLKQNPLSTNYIFYPQRVSLIYDANSFVFAALTLPLQFLTSTLFASNIVFLLSFVLSGLTMLVLAAYLLKTEPTKPFINRDRPRLLPLLAGLIYAFSPYTLSQALDGHTNLTTTWIIPLYTLFLLKALNRDNPHWRRDSFLAGVSAALQVYSDFTYTTFLLIETALILAYRIFTEFRKSPPLRQVTRLLRISLTISLTAAALSAPLIGEILRVTRMGFSPTSPLWVQDAWSADLLAFFLPSDRSTLFKSFSYTSARGTVEGTVLLGWTLTILFLSSLIFKRLRSKKLSRESEASLPKELWLYLTGAFFLLSLGPSLHINKTNLFDLIGFKNVVFPLPWFLLHKIPIIGQAQEPTRINPFLVMSLTIWLILFLKEFFTKYELKPFFRMAAITLLALLVLSEYLELPFPTTDLRPPAIYKTIAADLRHFSVLALPLGFNSGNFSLGQSPVGSLQYFQVIHEHPSFRATVARLPIWAFDYYRRLPLIKYLIDPAKTPDSDDLDRAKVYATLKNQLNVGYIVIHKDKYDGGDYQKVRRILTETLTLELMAEDEGTIAYKLK